MLLAVALLVLFPLPADAALPADFQRTTIASGLGEPTTLEFAPDGRIFVGQRNGNIYVIQNGALLPDPLIEIPAQTNLGERGLVGLAVDPTFATNGYLYAYYTTATQTPRNRVSRFTVTGNTAASEVVIWQNAAAAAEFHHGGAIRFGPDGNLYIATGDQANSDNSQDLSNEHGKILRVNPSNGAPAAGNPFAGGAAADDRIFAYGLRNPFRMVFDSMTGALWIGDVGGNSDDAYEEINLGVAGANYGWPDQEGPRCNVANCDDFTAPHFSYIHTDNEYVPGVTQASITLGPVYRGSSFPAGYTGNLFFGDYANRFIRRIAFNGMGAVTLNEVFATTSDAGTIVDMRVGPDGALYTVTFGLTFQGNNDPLGSAVHRITFGSGANQPPVAQATATPVQGVEPLEVTFDGSTSFDPDAGPSALTFEWDFGDEIGTSTEQSPMYVYEERGPYTATLTVDDGTDTSTDSVSITVGNPPTATITQPMVVDYRAGDAIAFAGTGNDDEDGALGPGAFTWRVLLVHAAHAHPSLGPISGVAGGTFNVPASGHGPENTSYEIQLTATDSDGLVATASRALTPETTQITFDTQPDGIPIFLDGEAQPTPRLYTTLVDFEHLVEAEPLTLVDEAPYVFASWSDAGARAHVFEAPEAPATLTATYAPAYALRFFGHGTNDIDRVKIPIDPQVPADVSGSFTLEWWMRADLADNDTAACDEGEDNWIVGNIIFDRDVFGPGDFGDYGVSIRDGRIAFGVVVGSAGDGICGAANVADGEWHHVAVTRNSGTGQLRIFVDGTLDNTGSGPPGDVSYNDGRDTGGNDNDPFFVIGAEKHDAGAAFPSYSGFVDEVRLSTNIRYTANFAPPDEPFDSDGNTAALWHFDEGPAGPCDGAILDSSAGGASDGECSFGGGAPAGPIYVAESPFAGSATPEFDAVLPPVRPIRVSIRANQASAERSVRVKVLRADDAPGDATFQLLASDGTCPAGTVSQPPDFSSRTAGVQGTAVLSAGRSATATLGIEPTSLGFDNVNTRTSTRCVLDLSVVAVAPGNVDPTPSNNAFPLVLYVIDRNDAQQTTAHESTLKPLKALRLSLRDGTAFASRTLAVSAKNADSIPASENPGHVVQVVVDDGDCPPGTVAALDFDRRTAGVQDSLMIRGGRSATARGTVQATSAAFLARERAPARCVAEISVVGPGGDVDPGNDSIPLVIDVDDKNDY